MLCCLLYYIMKPLSQTHDLTLFSIILILPVVKYFVKFRFWRHCWMRLLQTWVTAGDLMSSSCFKNLTKVFASSDKPFRQRFIMWTSTASLSHFSWKWRLWHVFEYFGILSSEKNWCWIALRTNVLENFPAFLFGTIYFLNFK